MPPTFEARRNGTLLPVEELARLPDALFWAEHCGWLPGSGYCRDYGCKPECIFRSLFLAEKQSIMRRRRSRRAQHRFPADRLPRMLWRVLFLAGFSVGLVWPFLGLDAVIAL